MNRIASRSILAALVLGGIACSKPELSSCDITQRACQEEIYFHLLSLRGDGYDPFGGLPPVGVITEDQFRQQLEQQDAAAQSSQKALDKAWNKTLLLLHFSTSAAATNADGGAGNDAGSSTIDDEVAHIYAFYDPTTKTVTVISHPSQTGAHVQEDAMVTLAHELVHALQDKELDLNKQDFHTSDEYYANDAIIEGDARFYEYLFTNDVRVMLGLGALDATTLPDQELTLDYANFDQLGSPLFAAQALIYPLGAKREATEYRKGGNAAIRHGYAKAPVHTVGLLVGSDGLVPPASSGNVCPAPYVGSLAGSTQPNGADQFGALLFYTFLRGWGVDHATAFSTAQSWTGDYLRVQASSDLTTTAAAWRIEFSQAPATTIVQTLTATGQIAAVADSLSLQITVSDAVSKPSWTAAPCQ
jgi:hypothetical protein